MIAVGLWGALLGPPALWILPIAFPIAMAAGGMLGLLGIPLPWVEIGIAASSILLGLFILTNVRLNLMVAIPLVMILALFHGHAHGTELSPGADAVLYSLGVRHCHGPASRVGNRDRSDRQAAYGQPRCAASAEASCWAEPIF